MPRTEKAVRAHGVLPTKFELEVVPIIRKRSRQEKRIMDRPAVDAEDSVYPLARDVVTGASVRTDWE